MIQRSIARSCIVPTLLCIAPLAAQGTAPPAACAGEPADEGGMRIAYTVPGTPEHAAELVNAALAAQGYATAQPVAAAGAWTAEPRQTWRPEHAQAMWHGATHPGLQVSGTIEPKGDSAEVTLVARTLCRLDPVAGAETLGNPGDLLERFSALDLMSAVATRSGRRGPLSSLRIPQRVGEFAFEGSVGDSTRTMMYGAMNGTLSAGVLVSSLGPMEAARCDPSCAEVMVQQVVANHFQGLRQIRGTATFKGMEVLVPATGDRWLAGRFVIHDVVTEARSNAVHLYVYAFPTHLVLFRGFVDASPGGAERVRAFVAAALASGLDGAPAGRAGSNR